MRWSGQRNTSGDCSDEHSDSATVSGSTERYDIMGLFGDSSYSIRVRVTNDAGSAVSDPLVISTTEYSEYILIIIINQ